jgi:hypothetical protein
VRGPTTAIVALLAAIGLGCAQILIEVPPDSNVRLLPAEEEAAERIEHKIWFALWGYYPLGDNTTAQVIEEHDLVEARFDTRQSPTDVVITAVTSLVGFQRRRIIVEGNREQAEP